VLSVRHKGDAEGLLHLHPYKDYGLVSSRISGTFTSVMCRCVPELSQIGQQIWEVWIRNSFTPLSEIWLTESISTELTITH
jgi:hypothetical protein